MITSTKRAAVILSGCGYLDGSEITESVSTLIALSELGVDYRCFTPDLDFEEVDHSVFPTALNQGSCHTINKRSLLSESARISRGEISPLAKLKSSDFDAIVFPGGFGAAKNLSSWASTGATCTVNEDVARVIREFHTAAKPIGAICISPALIACVLRNGVHLTIGSDPATAAEIEKAGAHHVSCTVIDYVSDRDHKVLSTPAYMLDAKPYEVFTGVRKMIRELVEMA